VCSRVSPLLYRRTEPERFATAFLAVLDSASGRVRYANAGHNPALLVRAAGEVERLAATGLPLGLLPEARYAAGEVTLGVGDLLVVYTDGIVEAANSDEEEFGLDRLIETCLRWRRESLEELAGALEADLQAFAAGVPFADDRTVVLARRQAT
jgi:sigma-B regulation protein RsbU (phosphoserine phosphatase)